MNELFLVENWGLRQRRDHPPEHRKKLKVPEMLRLVLKNCTQKTFLDSFTFWPIWRSLDSFKFFGRVRLKMFRNCYFKYYIQHYTRVGFCEPRGQIFVEPPAPRKKSLSSFTKLAMIIRFSVKKTMRWRPWLGPLPPQSGPVIQSIHNKRSIFLILGNISGFSNVLFKPLE